MSILSWIKAEFKAFLNHAEEEVVKYAEPALQFISDNGGKVALQLAEEVLSAAVSGTPWSTIISTFLTEAASSGITLAEGAAGAILNYAQSNLIAKGVITPPANTPAA